MTKMTSGKSHSALVLVNRRSGTVRSRGADAVAALVRETLAGIFAPLEVELVDGDVAARAKEAVRSTSHDIIIAGGGDGSIASVAAEVMGSTVAMGVLPLGTMNLVAQALGFSPRLEEALEQFGAAEIQAIDVGMANNRIFLHQVSFGLQPRMAKLREKVGYRSRLGKMLGAARSLAILAMRPRMVRVNVLIDGEHLRVSAPLVAITNNPIGSDKHWSLQHRLDGGVLGYYALSDLSLPGLLRLAKAYMRNRLHDDDIVENRITQKVVLKRRPLSLGVRYNRHKMRKGILSSLDGEVTVLKNPVIIRILPKNLRVLAVQQAATQEA
jgi:diacylglycerol kinase family enzyme